MTDVTDPLGLISSCIPEVTHCPTIGVVLPPGRAGEHEMNIVQSQVIVSAMRVGCRGETGGSRVVFLSAIFSCAKLGTKCDRFEGRGNGWNGITDMEIYPLKSGCDPKWSISGPKI